MNHENLDLNANPYAIVDDRLSVAGSVPYLPAKRVAGAMLCLSSIVILAVSAAMQEVGDMSVIGSLVVDLIIGVSLMKGSERLVIWAILRVALGLLVSVVAMSSVVELIFSVPLSVGLLLLLIGSPTKRRVLIGGMTVSVPLFLLVVLMIVEQFL